MWAAGRSIVIHKDDGSRWSCANLGEAGVGVDVDFTGPEVMGSIELFQPASGYQHYSWAYQTGSQFSTSVTVSLTGLQAPPGNKWHVHVDAVVNFGDCAATGDHYDPLTPNTSPPNVTYEIGDLSGKWGRLNGAASPGNFVGTGQGYVLDANLPLYGNYSVLNRSIVIHKLDGSRWACAAILNDPAYIYSPPPPPPPPPPLPPPPPSQSAPSTVQPSTETVVLTLTASGSVSDYSDTSSLQQAVATAAAVDKSLVTIRVAAASVIITATIAVPAATTATAVQASLSSTLGTAATASAALGIIVESDPVITTEELESSSSDSSSPIAIIVGAVAAAVVICLLCACLCMHKRRQNKHGGASHVTLNNPNAGGAAARGKPTKGYQMAVKDQKDLAPNQA